MQILSTWMSLESLSNTLLKALVWRQCLFSSFSRNCSSKVGWYYDPQSGSQGEKGLNFQLKTKNKCSVLLELLKRWLSSKLWSLWIVFIYLFIYLFIHLFVYLFIYLIIYLFIYLFIYLVLILFNPVSTGKLKNSIFEISVIPQTLNVNN